MYIRSKKIILFLFFLLFIPFVFFLLSRKDVPQQKPPIISSQPTPTIFIPQSTPTPTPQGKGRGFETEEFLQEQRESVANTPILQKLPADSSFFSIEYINEQHLIVYAETPNKDRDYEEARKWFVENNIDIQGIILEYK